MTSVKYIGLDVHRESISICVRNSLGKVVIESVIETKASTILQFIDGLHRDRSDSGRPADRRDADAESLPHQATEL
jgi:hypothetical protein